MNLRKLPGLQDYSTTWHAMREFTAQRDSNTEDELWLLQHYPVFTLGQAAKPEHLIDSSAVEKANIAIVKSDRGGQITYHGPGQLIAYLLLDLKRRNLGVRELVTTMEQSIIGLLQEYGLEAYAKKSAPGVYVQRNVSPHGTHRVEHKIASLGLRVRKGCCYHGLALNVDMDLAPFSLINPCGYAGLAVTQLADLLPQKPVWQEVEDKMSRFLQKELQ
jgi:lipoyl(octanoyl) transferase